MEPRRRPRSGATKVDDEAISFLACPKSLSHQIHYFKKY